MKYSELTKEQMAKLAECDGRHDSLSELFSCDSCNLLLELTECNLSLQLTEVK